MQITTEPYLVRVSNVIDAGWVYIIMDSETGDHAIRVHQTSYFPCDENKSKVELSLIEFSKNSLTQMVQEGITESEIRETVVPSIIGAWNFGSPLVCELNDFVDQELFAHGVG